jgi:hypothetical protein
MIKGSEIRKAHFPIELLLLDRWSPLAMSGEEITEEELIRLFEAACWGSVPIQRSGVACTVCSSWHQALAGVFRVTYGRFPQAGC